MAGSVTYSKNKIRSGDHTLVEEHIWSWTADSADGSVPATASDAIITGSIMHIVTNPGTPAPTDLYDITLTNADGDDVMGGEALNRSTTASESAMPAIGSGYGDRFVNSILTMNLTNNSVNSAVGVLKVYVSK